MELTSFNFDDLLRVIKIAVSTFDIQKIEMAERKEFLLWF